MAKDAVFSLVVNSSNRQCMFHIAEFGCLGVSIGYSLYRSSLIRHAFELVFVIRSILCGIYIGLLACMHDPIDTPAPSIGLSTVLVMK